MVSVPCGPRGDVRVHSSPAVFFGRKRVWSPRAARRASVVLSFLVLFLVLAVGEVLPLSADESSSAPPEEEEQDEPVLKGAAKKKHDKAVKAILTRFRKEKNRVLVAGAIEQLGVSATRVDRDALIRFSSGSKNQEYINKAFLALGKIGGKTSIEFLCGKNALRSKHFLVAQSAAHALALAKDDRATGPLLDVMLAKRTKTEVMGACALALGQSAPEDARVHEELLKYTRHKSDTRRAYALEGLGYLASDVAIERLKEVLKKDKNARVRGSAAKGMENSKRRDCIPALQAAIDSEKAFTVKEACMQAIRMLSR